MFRLCTTPSDADHWERAAGLGPFCLGTEMDPLFVRCREEKNYKRCLVELLAWMHDQDDGLTDKPRSEDFIVSLQFDGL